MAILSIGGRVIGSQSLSFGARNSPKGHSVWLYSVTACRRYDDEAFFISIEGGSEKEVRPRDVNNEIWRALEEVPPWPEVVMVKMGLVAGALWLVRMRPRDARELLESAMSSPMRGAFIMLPRVQFSPEGGGLPSRHMIVMLDCDAEPETTLLLRRTGEPGGFKAT